MQYSAILAIVSLASFAQAAPAVEKRGYTCVLNAAAANSENMGPVTAEPKKRQTGSSAPPDSFPDSEAPVIPNSFSSGMGITVAREGAKKAMWSSSSFDVWKVGQQTIKASDTGLPDDIIYKAAGTAPTFGCSITYQGKNYKCDGSSDISIDFVGSSIDQKGQAIFPC
jgi:hypothetical protein